MTERPGPGSAAVELGEEMEKKLVAALRGLFSREFDRELSEFQARRVLELIGQKLGPAVYNRAVADAAAYMTEAVADLQAILHAGRPRDFERP